MKTKTILSGAHGVYEYTVNTTETNQPFGR